MQQTKTSLLNFGPKILTSCDFVLVVADVTHTHIQSTPIRTEIFLGEASDWSVSIFNLTLKALFYFHDDRLSPLEDGWDHDVADASSLYVRKTQLRAQSRGQSMEKSASSMI